MRRIGLALLLVACGDDGGGDGSSTSDEPATGSTMASTSSSTGSGTSSESSGGESSSSSGVAESSSTGSLEDVVDCVGLPNEIAEWMECDGAYGVRLCVGEGSCGFTNACTCAQGEAQIEMRTEPGNIVVRSVGTYTIPDCGAYDPIDAMGTGCTSLPADTDLSFIVDDGVGNQVELGVRKNGAEMGTWSLLSFTAQ